MTYPIRNVLNLLSLSRKCLISLGVFTLKLLKCAEVDTHSCNSGGALLHRAGYLVSEKRDPVRLFSNVLDMHPACKRFFPPAVQRLTCNPVVPGERQGSRQLMGTELEGRSIT